VVPIELRNERRRAQRISRGKKESSDTRSPAQKDRDRILYTSSLRRLAQVTQVVAADKSHVFHNRLTHTLQVAQVGRRLAERLLKLDPELVEISEGLDPDVVEAACLAHDLGHPPFGHIAEMELNELAGSDIDGFEGNAQSFRIVTKLAQRSPQNRGLDLTRATLAAILKYPWKRSDEPVRKKPEKWGAYSSEEKDFVFASELLKSPKVKTLEAEIMDWADDITYSVHDLDDFFRAGRIPLHLLADEDYSAERNYFFESVFRRHASDAWWSRNKNELESAFKDVIIGLFPLPRPYSGIWEERAALRDFTSQMIGLYIGGTRLESESNRAVLKRDESSLRQVAMLKELTWTYVIESPALATQQAGQKQVIRKLHEIYLDAATFQKKNKADVFTPYFRQQLQKQSDPEKRRTVIDLIASMTEAQALAMHNRLVGTSVGYGLDEILS
jgi:dGTPase